jgi:hypothetical protein
VTEHDESSASSSLDAASTIEALTVLRSDIDRWLENLGISAEKGAMSTQHYGPVAKATDNLDRIVNALVAIVSERPGGAAVVGQNAADIDRASLGTRIDILKTADKQRVLGPRRVLKRAGGVQNMVSARNNWAHGRGGRTVDEAGAVLSTYRTGIEDLLRVAEALQEPT